MLGLGILPRTVFAMSFKKIEAKMGFFNVDLEADFLDAFSRVQPQSDTLKAMVADNKVETLLLNTAPAEDCKGECGGFRWGGRCYSV